MRKGEKTDGWGGGGWRKNFNFLLSLFMFRHYTFVFVSRSHLRNSFVSCSSQVDAAAENFKIEIESFKGMTITTTFHRTLWCCHSDRALNCARIKLNKLSALPCYTAVIGAREREGWTKKSDETLCGATMEFQIKTARDVISKLREEIKRWNVIESVVGLLRCSRGNFARFEKLHSSARDFCWWSK